MTTMMMMVVLMMHQWDRKIKKILLNIFVGQTETSLCVS